MRGAIGDGNLWAELAKPQGDRGFRASVKKETVGRILKLSDKFALGHFSRRSLAIIATLGVCLIGLLDYLSGYEITWSVVYVFPIALATWYVGLSFATFLGIVAVGLWVGGDIAAGAQFSSWLVPIWNWLIRLAFVGAFIYMLSLIRDLTDNLEAKVAARTADLERLERELLEAGERERRRIGSDLHDGLGQHLTGTSLAAQYLRRQLQRSGLPQVRQADELISLIEDGIALSHKLAKGLQPVDMSASGLMQALQDFAVSASDLLKVSCRFRCDAPVLLPDVGTAEQLYRIAQEATSNAVKHGRAGNVVISLESDDQGVVLRIVDDGSGFDPASVPEGRMGLRLMARRAGVVGAYFDIESRPGVGTTVSCRLPLQDRESMANV